MVLTVFIPQERGTCEELPYEMGIDTCKLIQECLLVLLRRLRTSLQFLDDPPGELVFMSLLNILVWYLNTVQITDTSVYQIILATCFPSVPVYYLPLQRNFFKKANNSSTTVFFYPNWVHWALNHSGEQFKKNGGFGFAYFL